VTRELRDPLDPVRWRKPLVLALGGLSVVLTLALGIPTVLHSRAAADRTAVAALVEAVRVPGGVDEPCTTGATRCWTTEATSGTVRTSVESQLRAARGSIVDSSCLTAPRAYVDDSCSVTGTVRGRTVTLIAFPLLAPEPPVRQIAIEVELWVLAAD